jgi:hypothetical protein
MGHFRQAGVTPLLSLTYLLFRYRNFIFGNTRAPIPDELWNAAADLRILLLLQPQVMN